MIDRQVQITRPGGTFDRQVQVQRLGELVDGDLKWSIDFRRVYATLLDQWLNLPSEAVLGQRFEPLSILRS